MEVLWVLKGKFLRILEFSEIAMYKKGFFDTVKNIKILFHELNFVTFINKFQFSIDHYGAI